MGIDALFDGSMEATAIEPPITPADPAPVIETPPANDPPQGDPAPVVPVDLAPVAEPEIKEDERNIPLPTFLDMRDRAKAAERRAAELEAQNAPKPTPAEMPDPIDDPRGFADWQQGQFQQAIIAERFAISDTIAKQQYGAETVETAAKWAMERAATDPSFKMAYMQQQHPLDWIVREHKRSGLISEIGDNVDDWFAKEAAKRGYAATSAPNAAPTPVVAAQAQPVSQAPSPPRSLASEPGKGGGVKDVPTGPMSALESVFRG